MTTVCAVSVVIPCFNHGQFLPEAVASVIDIGRDDIELIVVDDGSTDELSCKELSILRDKGINVIRQPNRGLAAARNAGIFIAKGKYILPLDADNRVRSGYFEHAIRILDGNSQVGVVYGDAQYIGSRAGRWHVGGFERDRLLRRNYIDACAIFRRSIWEQNGGYDGTMPVQGEEDWDFWLSTVEHGWQFAYVSEVLFDYRVSEESMTTRFAAFRGQLDRFVAAKHALLYRDSYLQLLTEKTSVKATSRNLYRSLKSRFRAKFSNNKDE